MLNTDPDALEKIQQTKTVRVATAILKLATTSRKALKNLPFNLCERMDEILYTKL